jgi:hypothetical protein
MIIHVHAYTLLRLSMDADVLVSLEHSSNHSVMLLSIPSGQCVHHGTNTNRPIVCEYRVIHKFVHLY